MTYDIGIFCFVSLLTNFVPAIRLLIIAPVLTHTVPQETKLQLPFSYFRTWILQKDLWIFLLFSNGNSVFYCQNLALYRQILMLQIYMSVSLNDELILPILGLSLHFLANYGKLKSHSSVSLVCRNPKVNHVTVMHLGQPCGLSVYSDDRQRILNFRPSLIPYGKR